MKQSVRYHHALFIYASHTNPGFSFSLLCLQTYILVCLHEFTEIQRKNTKGVFLNRDCWDSTQKNECWLMHARTAHRGTMQWEYSPPQMSLAKTSHTVLANSKEAGKCSSPGCPGRREPDMGSTHVKPLSSWSFQWPGEEKEINVLEYFKYCILPFHFSISFASACNTSWFLSLTGGDCSSQCSLPKVFQVLCDKARIKPIAVWP